MSFLQNSLALNIILGVLMALIGYTCSFFLDSFGQEKEVAQAARPYLVIVVVSLIPLMYFQTYRQFAEGLSDTFNPMIVSIVTNLLNVGLNYIFIYGMYAIPAMGLIGAAYATLISRLLMALLMWWAIRKKLSGFSWNFDPQEIIRMLKIGLPTGMQYVFEIGAFATAAIMVGWISAEALAAHQIALNLASITYMCATGIAAAGTIRIGNQMGLKDIKNLKIAGYSCFALVAVFMSVTAFVFIFFRTSLASLYVNEIAVRDLAATLLIVVGAFQISDGVQAVGLGVLRGLTDVKIPTAITFTAYWLIAIPGGYILGFVFDLGVLGIWYSLSAGLTIAAVMHLTRFAIITSRLSFN